MKFIKPNLGGGLLQVYLKCVDELQLNTLQTPKTGEISRLIFVHRCCVRLRDSKGRAPDLSMVGGDSEVREISPDPVSTKNNNVPSSLVGRLDVVWDRPQVGGTIVSVFV